MLKHNSFERQSHRDVDRSVDDGDLQQGLSELSGDYHKLGTDIDRMRQEVCEMSGEVGRLMEQVNVLVNAIGGGNPESSKPEAGSGPGAENLSDLSLEAIRDIPHDIEDDLIIRCKDSVLMQAGGDPYRNQGTMYGRLVKDKLDDSDVDFMSSPDAAEKFASSLAAFRGRWKKTFQAKRDDGSIRERSNVSDQDNTFVHFYTDADMQKVMEGGRREADTRFYLNPRMSDAVDILEQILSEANRRGLSAGGKINHENPRVYARAYRRNKPKYESGQMDVRKLDIRTDNVVLYCTDSKDRDEFLDIVRKVYAANASSFTERSCPKAPFRVADGFAVGEEPRGGESLNDVVADALCDAMLEVDRKTWVQVGGRASDVSDAVWLSEVKKVLPSIYGQKGISKTNIAFRD